MNIAARSHFLSRAGTGVVLAAALALAGCTFAPSGGGTAAGTGATSQGAPSSAADSPPALPSGLFGGFGSKNEACLSVAASVAIIGLLPVGVALGGNQSDVDKARDSIRQMEAKVPDERKPAFAQLQEVVNRMGTDFSSFDSQSFETALKPITDWLDQNCTTS